MEKIDRVKKVLLDFLSKQRPDSIEELGDGVLSMPISEFGFDSLDQLTLTLDIEQASGATFTTEDLSKYPTMKSILESYNSDH